MPAWPQLGIGSNAAVVDQKAQDLRLKPSALILKSMVGKCRLWRQLWYVDLNNKIKGVSRDGLHKLLKI
ncbi:hypothetical protein CFF01_06255 [Shewanella marisflavi]|uniref:Uncharacterized protein n=1 Tax=Shewanella marisflavi TaxID=260364 RepID=A0AAC9XMS2_9GAMM|nr:hypothetical protein CFF01_06255 [Shewanella marisflavi]